MSHYECKGCGKFYSYCECVPPNAIAPPVLQKTKNFGQMTTIPVQSSNMGWKCPGCGCCYAPHIQKCYTCGVPTHETA